MGRSDDVCAIRSAGDTLAGLRCLFDPEAAEKNVIKSTALLLTVLTSQAPAAATAAAAVDDGRHRVRLPSAMKL